MSNKIEIYVKQTSNCRGLELQTFERLSPTWTGESLLLPFGEGEERRTLTVVGWTDLRGGGPCPVHVVEARWLPHQRETAQPAGFLIYGGNSGLRALDDDAEPTPDVDEHLPRGYGCPILWVADVADLPPEVRTVVERAICEHCGVELPESASPYWLNHLGKVWLCDRCADPD